MSGVCASVCVSEREKERREEEKLKTNHSWIGMKKMVERRNKRPESDDNTSG